MTIAVSGKVALISRAASNPFKTGMVTFRTTTSCFNLCASSIALAPFTASAHTSKCGTVSNVDRDHRPYYRLVVGDENSDASISCLHFITDRVSHFSGYLGSPGRGIQSAGYFQ